MDLSFTFQLDFASRLIIAFLLIVAGFSKIRNPRLTAETIQNFGIVPKKLSFGLGIFLSLVEIITGFGIIIPGSIVFASFISANIFFIFTIALIHALVTHKSIVCGCFGDMRRERLNWLTVIRSTSLLGASLVTYTLNANHGNLLNSGNLLSIYLVIGGTLLAIGGLISSFKFFSLEGSSQEELALNPSRRDFLKLLGAFTLALATLPVKPALATHCCKCQLYRHYDPFCCASNPFFHIRHYFKRCCNSCTGQKGGWHSYPPTGPVCECECAEPVSTCGDLIYSCAGSACYSSECSPCHYP